jgi:hypothetical protein
MIRLSRLAASAASALVLLVLLPDAVAAQRRAVPRGHPPHPRPSVVVRGRVFIGGYFYDPVFGPYPWWPRTAYPYWYVPIYDRHADILLRVEPKAAEDAGVYVDGFYAGIVDDFNGVFQSLSLTPGGHRIALYLEGYRTVHRNVYLRPGSTFHLRETMLRLPTGETSELPDVVPGSSAACRQLPDPGDAACHVGGHAAPGASGSRPRDARSVRAAGQRGSHNRRPTVVEL